MKKLVILILSLTAAVSTFAQNKTVTNADLEKFRQQRVEAEKQLKERYAEMGFPSPEQLEKQNAERRAKMDEYSDQLRQQRLQSEIEEANRQIADLDAQLNYLRQQGGGYYNPGVIYSYGYAPFGYVPFGFRRNHFFRPRIQRLPQNISTALDYGRMNPSPQDYYNQAIGVRPGFRTGPRIGGGRSGGGGFRR